MPDLSLNSLERSATRERTVERNTRNARIDTNRVPSPLAKLSYRMPLAANMPKVQQGDNARQLKWHQAHQNFYDRRPEYEPPKHRLSPLLQPNPEAYNTNRFSIFRELFERLRFQSTIARVAVWVLES